MLSRIWQPPITNSLVRGPGGGLLRGPQGGLGRDIDCCCVVQRRDCSYYDGANTPNAGAVTVTLSSSPTKPTYTGVAWKADEQCCLNMPLNFSLAIRSAPGPSDDEQFDWSLFSTLPGLRIEGANCYDANCEMEPGVDWGMQIYACCQSALGAGCRITPVWSPPAGNDILWIVAFNINGVPGLSDPPPDPPHDCDGTQRTEIQYYYWQDSSLPKVYSGNFLLTKAPLVASPPNFVYNRTTYCTFPQTLMLNAPQ